MKFRVRKRGSGEFRTHERICIGFTRWEQTSKDTFDGWGYRNIKRLSDMELRVYFEDQYDTFKRYLVHRGLEDRFQALAMQKMDYLKDSPLYRYIKVDEKGKEYIDIVLDETGGPTYCLNQILTAIARNQVDNPEAWYTYFNTLSKLDVKDGMRALMGFSFYSFPIITGHGTFQPPADWAELYSRGLIGEFLELANNPKGILKHSGQCLDIFHVLKQELKQQGVPLRPKKIFKYDLDYGANKNRLNHVIENFLEIKI